MKKRQPSRPVCVLSIAGVDSGGGAGVLADARAIQASGGFATAAVTAVTAQNGRGVRAWRAMPAALVVAQVQAVWDEMPVGAIKTGLLPGAIVGPLAGVLRRELRRTPEVALVVDPVLGSTTGTRFLPPRSVAVLKKELCPLATLVTPNWPEAAELTGLPVRSEGDAEEAGRALVAAGCRAVLVKGGHGKGPVVRDCLVTADGRVRWFSSRRVKTRNTHGTGCVLSAAIAAGLARGLGLGEAVASGRRVVVAGLRENRRRRWGGGKGPALA